MRNIKIPHLCIQNLTLIPAHLLDDIIVGELDGTNENGSSSSTEIRIDKLEGNVSSSQMCESTLVAAFLNVYNIQNKTWLLTFSIV